MSRALPPPPFLKDKEHPAGAICKNSVELKSPNHKPSPARCKDNYAESRHPLVELLAQIDDFPLLHFCFCTSDLKFMSSPPAPDMRLCTIFRKRMEQKRTNTGEEQEGHRREDEPFRLAPSSFGRP